jgi:hypothetical protein
MPRLIEMGDLIRRCQQRADKVGDDHIGGDDTTEWHSLISEVYGADVYCVVAESAGRVLRVQVHADDDRRRLRGRADRLLSH